MAVSVIIPNFNNAAYIGRCIESVAEDPAVGEIVVYDNASTDGSAELIESFDIEKVRLIRGRTNLGAALGRQRAVEAAAGEFLCTLDGDDFLSPGAVTGALRDAGRLELDIALFQLFDVDPDGNKPKPAIAVAPEVISGRTACERTLGGWNIHPLGLIRRSVYRDALKHFVPHGYSDDELLTRYIFLAAKRVAGTSGSYFYRRLPKPRSLAREMGATRTAVEVLRLSVNAGLAEEALRRQRNMVVRFLLGAARRRLLGRIDRSELSQLLRAFDAMKVPWRRGDVRSWLVERALRLIAR